jgi:hypothetical protein
MFLGDTSRILALFAIEISFCILLAGILSFHPPRPLLRSFSASSDHHFLIPSFLIQNTWTDFLSLKLRQGFNAYWSYCRQSDYLRPLSGECLNSSGLSLTLIESLEALFLGHLTDEYMSAREYVVNSFRCNAGDWINVNEMAGKVIGGLLGIFGITNDVGFLTKAVECGEVALMAFHGPIPHPIVDGIRRAGTDYGFMSGNFLSEASGFLVEFEALSRLTGDARFSGAVDRFLQCLLGNSDKLHYSVWDTKKCRVKGNHTGLTSYTVPFFRNLIRLHLMNPSQITDSLVTRVLDVLEKADFAAEDVRSVCSLPLFLDSLSSERAREVSRKITTFCESMGDSRNGKHFAFESESLIGAITQNQSVDLLPYVVILNQTQCGPAQCSLIDSTIQENVQPSAALGQWLKFLLLANSPFPAGSFILNEYGHFIPTAQLK